MGAGGKRRANSCGLTACSRRGIGERKGLLKATEAAAAAASEQDDGRSGLLTAGRPSCAGDVVLKLSFTPPGARCKLLLPRLAGSKPPMREIQAWLGSRQC